MPLLTLPIPMTFQASAVLAMLVVGLILILVFSFLQNLALRFWHLLHLRLWVPRFTLASRQANEVDMPILQTARADMLAAGFIFTHSRKIRDVRFSHADIAQCQDVYYHKKRDIHAIVFAASCPQLGKCYEIELQNAYADGRFLITHWRGSAQFRLLPAHAIQVLASQPDLRQLLQAHLHRRQQIGAARIDPVESLSMFRAWGERLLLWLCHEKKACTSRQRFQGLDLFRLRLPYALSLSGQQQRAAYWRWHYNWQTWLASIGPRFASHWRAWFGRAHPQQLAPSRAAEAMQQAQQQRWRQMWALAHSAQAPFWLRLLPFAILACALLLLSGHLGGHSALLAAICLLFGHAGVQLATARLLAWRKKVHAPHPLLHLLHYLAAPVLGLGLASTCLVLMVSGGFAGLMQEQQVFIWWLIVLSLGFYILQLLPLRPLLGGYVFAVLFPWVLPRFLMLLGLSVALIAAALIGHRYLVLILACLLLVRLPGLWRQLKATRQLRRLNTHEQGRQLDAGKIWQALDSAKLGTEHMFVLAKLAKRAQSHRTSAVTSLFGLIVYLACVGALPLVLGTLLLSQPRQTLAWWQAGPLAQRAEHKQIAPQGEELQAANALKKTKLVQKRAATSKLGGH